MKRMLARELGRPLAAAAVLILVAARSAPAQDVVAIVGGNVFLGTEAPLLADGVVVVEGARIRAVGARGQIAIPEGATVIEAAGATVLPGLADLHIHPAHFIGSPRRFEDDSLSALRASAILRQALDAGITLVRDAGARNRVGIGLKLALAEGYIEGARYVTCGTIVGITGAHGSEFELMLEPRWLLESDSPAEWRKHIRYNFKMGADFVKVTPPFTREEIEIAAEEAHRFGALLAVDAAGQVFPGMMMVEHAVAAGADTIEHLAPMKNEAKVIAMMKEKGTIVVPTVSASRRFAGERWTNPGERQIREKTRPQDYEERFRNLHAAGVPMAVGTDTGGKDQGEIGAFYVDELQLWMDWGYGAHEVLQAATRIGAQAAGLGDELGTLEPGKRADLILVPGNPLEDISRVTEPILVMKDGAIVRRKSSPGPSTTP